LALPGFSLIPQMYDDEEEGSEGGAKKLELEPVNRPLVSMENASEDVVERHRHVSRSARLSSSFWQRTCLLILWRRL
jgi:hypothetical protein